MKESGASREAGASVAVPPGWRRNPSAWSERLIALALALAGFAIALYLALYQSRIIGNVWEPLFGNGSYLVLHSPLSRLLPIPDAALGALGYAAEFICGVVGGSQRWRTLPWMAVIFGVVAIGMALVSTVLVICQPLIAHAWCTLCLCSAAISFIVLGLGISELRAGLQTLRERKNAGQGPNQTLSGRGFKTGDAPAS